MPYNLSSNQQYLLSLVQQNNPEILSKFLNEGSIDRFRSHADPLESGVTDAQRARWAERDNAAAAAKEKAKNDPYGAVRMAKARRGELDADPTIAAEQQSRLKRSDEKYKAIDALKKEHYTDLLRRTANMDPETMDAKTAGELLMYKIESGQTKKTAAERMRDIAMGGALTKSPEQEEREQDLLKATSMAAEPGTFGERFKTMSADEIGSIAARAAKKESDEKTRISPYYKTTRAQFKAATGRDFLDASSENMRTLQAIETDLPGRLEKIERDWQDDRSYDAQMAAASKFNLKQYVPYSKEWYRQQKELMDATYEAKGKAEKNNPVYHHTISSFDVPPAMRRTMGPNGEFIDAETRTDNRTLPTTPKDTNRKTAWEMRKLHNSLQDMWNDPKQRELMKQQGVDPMSMFNSPVEGADEEDDLRIDWNKGFGSLSGKSVNQKIDRIA